MIYCINISIIILSCLCMIYAWLSPNHYMPWMTAYSDFSTFLAIVLLTLYLIINNKTFKLPRILIFFILLAMLPILQFIGGKIPFFGDALIVALYIYAFSLSAFTAYNLVKDKNNKEKMYNIIFSLIIFSGLVSIYIALTQWFLIRTGSVFIVDLADHGRPFANFAQPNTLSTFLFMGLLAILYFYEKNYFNKVCAGLLGGVFIFGIVLTQSRTAWVTIPFLMIWWLWKSPTFHAKMGKLALCLWIIIFIVFIYIIPMIAQQLDIANTSNFIERATTGHSRIAMWQQMILAIQEKPWFGYGWHQVSVAQFNMMPFFPTHEMTKHSHNIILELIISNGLPLAILIIFFISYWLWLLSKLANNIEITIALAMVGVVLIHAMFEYPLEYAFFLLPIGFLLGLILSENQYISIIPVSRNSFIIIVFVNIFLYVFILKEYIVIEKDVRLARFELLNIGTLHAAQAAPNVILLTKQREELRFMRTKPVKNLSAERLEWMKHVAFSNGSPLALHRYAQALALNNYKHESLQILSSVNQLYGLNYTYNSLFKEDQSLAFAWEYANSRSQLKKSIVNE